jgi:hypothetical protein
MALRPSRNRLALQLDAMEREGITLRPTILADQ